MVFLLGGHRHAICSSKGDRFAAVPWGEGRNVHETQVIPLGIPSTTITSGLVSGKLRWLSLAEARVQIGQDWTFGSLRWRTGSDHQRCGWKQRECMMENEWAEWDLAEEQWHSHRQVSCSTGQEQCSGTANLMQDSQALALFRTPGLHHCWLWEPPGHVLWVHSLCNCTYLAATTWLVGTRFPDQGSIQWKWKGGILITGPPGNSLSDFKIARATVCYLLTQV